MTATRLQDRLCPFCQLHCDDLEIAVDGARVDVLSGGCPIVASQVTATGLGPQTPPPSIAGREVSLADALTEAARLLAAAHAPMVTGLSADVDGVRKALDIADKTGAVMDHSVSDGFFNNMNVMQRRGALYTTPAEVRNRADVVVLIGTDFWTRLPRFFDRYLPEGDRLFQANPSARKVFYLGNQTQLPPIPGSEVTVIDAKLDRTAEMVLALNALFEGRSLQAATVAGVPVAKLAEIAEAIKQSTYTVFAWEPPALGASGDLAVESLYDLILSINKTQRAAGLPLPPPGHMMGAYQVCLWQAGTTMRTDFASGVPLYDPRLFSYGRQMADRRVDTLLWVTALPGPLPTAKPDVPLVLVSSLPPPQGVVPDVFIPVSMPGRDHSGQFFRGEGVVSIHGEAMVSSSALPSAAAALSDLARLLPEREVPRC